MFCMTAQVIKKAALIEAAFLFSPIITMSGSPYNRPRHRHRMSLVLAH